MTTPTKHPICTEVPCSCTGNEEYQTDGHRDEYINSGGYAVCSCHSKDRAGVHDVKRFSCQRAGGDAS